MSYSWKQEWFIRKMAALGYEEVSTEGQCFGIANMAMQAFLLEDMTSFSRRIDLIRALSEEDIRNIKAAGLGDDVEISRGDTIKPLDIYAFFDGVQLYQEPFRFPKILKTDSQMSRQASSIILETDQENNPKYVSSLIYFGDIAILSDYLDLLSRNFTSPMSFMFSNSLHSTNLSFDPERKEWYFTDANDLPTKVFSEDRIYNLAELIFQANKTQFERYSIMGVMNYKVLGLQMFVQAKHYETSKRKLDELDLLNFLKLPHEIELRQKICQRIVYFAAIYGDLNAMVWLKDNGYKFDNIGWRLSGFFPTLIAAEHGHTKILEFFLSDKFEDIYFPWNELLFIAAYNGHQEVVDFILSNGDDVDINKINSDGYTPLSWAAMGGHLDLVKAMITKGSKLQDVLPDGKRIIDLVRENHPKVADFLQEILTQQQAAKTIFKAVKQHYTKRHEEKNKLTGDENPEMKKRWY